MRNQERSAAQEVSQKVDGSSFQTRLDLLYHTTHLYPLWFCNNQNLKMSFPLVCNCTCMQLSKKHYFVTKGCYHRKQTIFPLHVLNPGLLPDLFNLTDVEVVVPVDLVLTALSLLCVIDRCAGGKCDVEEENIRWNSVRLHQTWLGSSTVRLRSVCLLVFSLCVSAGNFKGTQWAGKTGWICCSL